MEPQRIIDVVRTASSAGGQLITFELDAIKAIETRGRPEPQIAIAGLCKSGDSIGHAFSSRPGSVLKLEKAAVTRVAEHRRAGERSEKNSNDSESVRPVGYHSASSFRKPLKSNCW